MILTKSLIGFVIALALTTRAEAAPDPENESEFARPLRARRLG
ncbi:MAG: hypothetical protein P9C48_03390 [Defluviicoccus sp.]|nr:hypothetical protein [Defluviicoccus sp.]MDG4608154.1 hypothetical protein [Defluviicoccus sp.]